MVKVKYKHSPYSRGVKINCSSWWEELKPYYKQRGEREERIVAIFVTNLLKGYLRAFEHAGLVSGNSLFFTLSMADLSCLSDHGLIITFSEWSFF